MSLKSKENIIVKKISDSEEALKVLSEFGEYKFLEKLKGIEERKAFAEKWAENADFLVAYCDGDIIGCFVMYTDNTVDGSAFITLIVTKQEVRALGLFALFKFWDAAISICREKNLTKVKLEVDKTNKKAQASSKSLGFKYSGDASENTVFMEASVDEIEKRIEKLRSLMERTSGK